MSVQTFALQSTGHTEQMKEDKEEEVLSVIRGSGASRCPGTNSNGSSSGGLFLAAPVIQKELFLTPLATLTKIVFKKKKEEEERL